jgi:hypothetical protein
MAYNKGMDQSSFANERHRADSTLSSTSTEIAGLGEAAYSKTFATINSVSFLKNHVRVMITSSASLEKEKQLAALIVEKL